MRIQSPIAAACACAALGLAGCAAPAPVALDRGDAARDQVIASERAFARSMAERSLDAFTAFVAEDAVFFGAGDKPLRGKAEVVAAWAPLYASPQAPFSWEPRLVEVLGDGTLALSSGPVRNPQGELVGCFSSIWRQDAPGRWHIVFDRGTGPQECRE